MTTRKNTTQEPAMTATKTTYILSVADLADAYEHSLHEVHDQDGNWHDAPRLTNRDLGLLDAGEIVALDATTQIIAPRWPTSIRATHVGARPAEIRAAALGKRPAEAEDWMRKIAAAERAGQYDAYADIESPSPEFMAAAEAL